MKRFLIVLAVLIGLALIFLAVSSPSAFSNSDDDIDQWNSELEAGPIEPMSAVMSTSQRIDRYRSRLYTVRRQQLSVQGWCDTARGKISGGNIVDRSIVRGILSIRWCWTERHAILNQQVQVNFDCETDQWAFWKCAIGDTHLVKGSGWHYDLYNHWEYLYRRARFKFYRGLYNSISQEVNPWISLTVRGNGQCLMDKMENGPHVKCSDVR